MVDAIEKIIKKTFPTRIKDVVSPAPTKIGPVAPKKRRRRRTRRVPLIPDVVTPAPKPVTPIEKVLKKAAPKRIIRAVTPAPTAQQRQLQQIIQSEFFKAGKRRDIERERLQELQRRITQPQVTRSLLTTIQQKRTLPPQEREKFTREEAARAKKILKKQIQQLKTAPIEFSKGALEVVKEYATFIPKTIQGSYNLGKKYGTSVRKRAAKEDLAKTEVIIRDLIKIGKSSKKIAKFVKDNPKEAALVVGATAGIAGKSYLKTFSANPAKGVGRAVAFWVTPTIVAKGIKKLKPTKIPVVKYSKNTFKSSQSLTTGKSKLEGKIQGVWKDKRKFKTDYKLNYDPKTKTYTGTAKTVSGKQTFSEKLKIKDQNGFYKDLVTGEKFGKIRAPIKTRRITVKETVITPKGPSKLVIRGDKVAQLEKADIKTTVTKIIDNTKQETVRRAKAVKAVDPQTKKVIGAVSQQVSKVRQTKKIAKIKNLTDAQTKQLESFLKSIDYDKKILGGLDKRRRLARELGLRKTSLLKDFETVVTPKGKVKAIFRKGTAKAKGEIIIGVEPKPKIKIKSRRIPLKRNKKGYTSLIKDSKFTVSKKVGKKLVRDKSITIPKLKSRLPLTQANLARYRVLKAFDSLIKDLKTVESLKDITDIKEKIKEINKRIQKTDIKDKTREKEREKIKERQKERIKTKIKKKIELTKKTVPKEPTPTKPTPTRIPRIRPTPKVPKKPTKLPKVSLNFNTKLKRGERLKFDMRVRIKGKPKTVKLGLPLNKALKKAGSLVDNTTARSFDLVITGITKAKDIRKPGLAKKFRQRRTTNALKNVEYRKYGIDSPGEKRGLKLSKAIKKTTKRKKSSRNKR